MPAFYAHDRFGKEVSARLNGELKEIVKRYYRQFRIGLQGPDLFFFYRPYLPNKVSEYGNHLHAISAYPFFEHAAPRKPVGFWGAFSSRFDLHYL